MLSNISFLYIHFNYRGDDPARICNVEPLQDNPLSSSVLLHTGSVPFLYFCRDLLQSQHPLLRYVSDLNQKYQCDIGSMILPVLPFSPVMVVQVQDFTRCNHSINVPSHAEIYFTIPRLILAALLLILTVTQTLKQSIEMYKATMQWQPNQYMMFLVKEGILYFILYVLLFLLFNLFRSPSSSPGPSV